MQITVVGGDQQSVYLTAAINRRSNDHATHVLHENVLHMHDAIGHADMVILPANYMGGIVKGKAGAVQGLEIVKQMRANGYLVCGCSDQALAELAKKRNIQILELLRQPHFSLANAQLTAEAALMRAGFVSERSLVNCSCLVLGSGRIAKALLRLLRGYTPNAALCARSSVARQEARWAGYPVYALTQGEQACKGRTFVWNTIPSRVVQPAWLEAMQENGWFIDLASAPYGIDSASIPANINYALESGLPGRILPMAAAEVIYQTIFPDHKEEGETG